VLEDVLRRDVRRADDGFEVDGTPEEHLVSLSSVRMAL
jgi:hypothetical protein